MTPKRRIIPFFIPNTGCARDCVFCDQRLISGETASVSPDRVRSAINRLLEADQFGFAHGEGRQDEESRGTSSTPEHTAQPAPFEVAFYGGSFTAIGESLQNELLEAARPLLDLSPKNSIRVSTRPDGIDEAIVGRLKGYGVATIELGAQSMRDDVLAAARRGHTAGDVEKAAGIVKSAGLSLILQMMTGLPRDTDEKSILTAKRFVSLGPDGVRIYPTVVVRGTKLHEMWLGGEYREHSVGEAVALCAKLCPLFEEAGIPVIRLGLNPSDGLSAGDAVAGAYHPAFGELVYSRMYYEKACALLDGITPHSSVAITVPGGHKSRMTGPRRQNIGMLTEKYSLSALKIVESDTDTSEIKIEIT